MNLFLLIRRKLASTPGLRRISVVSEVFRRLLLTGTPISAQPRTFLKLTHTLIVNLELQRIGERRWVVEDIHCSDVHSCHGELRFEKKTRQVINPLVSSPRK